MFELIEARMNVQAGTNGGPERPGPIDRAGFTSINASGDIP
jgi:hypothetical protein